MKAERAGKSLTVAAGETSVAAAKCCVILESASNNRLLREKGRTPIGIVSIVHCPEVFKSLFWHTGSVPVFHGTTPAIRRQNHSLLLDVMADQWQSL